MIGQILMRTSTVTIREQKLPASGGETESVPAESFTPSGSWFGRALKGAVFAGTLAVGLGIASPQTASACDFYNPCQPRIEQQYYGWDGQLHRNSVGVNQWGGQYQTRERTNGLVSQGSGVAQVPGGTLHRNCTYVLGVGGCTDTFVPNTPWYFGR